MFAPNASNGNQRLGHGTARSRCIASAVAVCSTRKALTT